MTVATTLDGGPRCDAWTQPRRRGGIRGIRRGQWGLVHQCPSPTKFTVKAADRHGNPDPQKAPWGPVQPCGRHVRPYLMDNGDSVWQPWIITRIVPAPYQTRLAPGITYAAPD